MFVSMLDPLVHFVHLILRSPGFATAVCPGHHDIVRRN